MSELFGFIWCAIAGLFRSRVALQTEILVLRHQLNILRRGSPKRVVLGKIDRLVFCGLYRLSPKVLDALKILQPETVIRWHRAGFRAYWRWKSRPRGGRPRIPADIRHLILEMSVANPLWGASRIHGELLKLGIDVGQTTVAKYMARRRRPPSQGWKTFLRNHTDGIASIDLFVVPTISFRLLYALLVLRHSRRKLLWLGVTAHPSAEWIARQLTEACGWNERPRYVIRDRDGAYGETFIRRLTAMGIRDRPISARSPWAKRRRRKDDRIDPSGLPRSRRDLWRAASPPFAQLLPRILQRESYAPIAEEGHTDPARCPEGRTRARPANLGWASPSVRSSLNIRQGQPCFGV